MGCGTLKRFPVYCEFVLDPGAAGQFPAPDADYSGMTGLPMIHDFAGGRSPFGEVAKHGRDVGDYDAQNYQGDDGKYQKISKVFHAN